MKVDITLTIADTETGPFDIYSDIDGFNVPFESNVSRSALVSGYSSNIVPDYATILRLRSKGICLNSVDIPISIIPGPYEFYVTNSSTTAAAVCPDMAYIIPLWCNEQMPALGSIMYDDNTMLFPYVGGNLYFKLIPALDPPEESAIVVRIDDNGTVTDTYVCNQ
jgi:hypothetical protein